MEERRREEEEEGAKGRKAAGEVLPVPMPQRPNGKSRGRMEGSLRVSVREGLRCLCLLLAVSSTPAYCRLFFLRRPSSVTCVLLDPAGQPRRIISAHCTSFGA